MGYNTTVVVLNDALGGIAADPEFGARLADAIKQVYRGQSVTVAAHGKNSIHCNAAIVIETHHADHEVLVRVGGNTGRIAKDAMDAEARGVEGMVPAISANGSDADMLAYLDELLAVQGRLMFARENFDGEEAEAFGVAILDFMRLYGMRLRAALAGKDGA